MARRALDDPFPNVLDQAFELGPDLGNQAFFGRNVLGGLVTGVRDFIDCKQERWCRRRYHVIGPILLGCSPWLGDTDLFQVLADLHGACIVITKLPKSSGESRAWRRLRAINDKLPGVPATAFPQLGGMLPTEGGNPVVVGPFDKVDDDTLNISAFRTIGRRKLDPAANPPIAHAKLALLGHLWWADEDGHGYPAEILGFRPLRLWISSANFTYPSRRSLETGFWTEDPALIDGAYTFLSQLMASSEQLHA
jgi:hypothetical protein